jgi:hypothetical protein
VRTAYIDVTGEVAVELARELRRAVDEVDPAVGMGLCASYTHWDVEGCDLLELVGAFAGKGRKVLRISGAPYWANAKLPGTGLADIIEFVRMQSAWTRGLDMTVFDENDPYPRKVARVPPWRCELYDKAVIADGRLARHKYMLCYGVDRAEPGYLEAHLADMPDDPKLRRIFAGTAPYGVKVDCPQHRLRTAELEMQPPHHVLHGERAVVLHEHVLHAVLEVTLRVVRLREPAARVAVGVERDDPEAGDVACLECLCHGGK